MQQQQSYPARTCPTRSLSQQGILQTLGGLFRSGVGEEGLGSGDAVRGDDNHGMDYSVNPSRDCVTPGDNIDSSFTTTDTNCRWIRANKDFGDDCSHDPLSEEDGSLDDDEVMPRGWRRRLIRRGRWRKSLHGDSDDGKPTASDCADGRVKHVHWVSDYNDPGDADSGSNTSNSSRSLASVGCSVSRYDLDVSDHERRQHANANSDEETKFRSQNLQKPSSNPTLKSTHSSSGTSSYSMLSSSTQPPTSTLTAATTVSSSSKTTTSLSNISGSNSFRTNSTGTTDGEPSLGDSSNKSNIDISDYRDFDSDTPSPSASFVVLMEIVGAICLKRDSVTKSTTTKKATTEASSSINSDKKESSSAIVSPYCVVKVLTQQDEQGQNNGSAGDVSVRKVHRTSTIKHDPNPIWTVKTRSLCLLNLSSTAGTNGAVSHNGPAASVQPQMEESHQKDHYNRRIKEESPTNDCGYASSDMDSEITINVTHTLSDEEQSIDAASEASTKANGRPRRHRRSSSRLSFCRKSRRTRRSMRGSVCSNSYETLLIEVKDGTNKIGYVSISGTDILKENGDRKEYEIVPYGEEQENGKDSNATLALRFRIASRNDISFVEKLYNKTLKKSTLALEGTAPRKNTSDWDSDTAAQAGGTGDCYCDASQLQPMNRSRRNSLDINFKNVNGWKAASRKLERMSHSKRLCRLSMRNIRLSTKIVNTLNAVPNRPVDKHAECMKPSMKWIQVGSCANIAQSKTSTSCTRSDPDIDSSISTMAGIGTLYLEILKCDNLPNMDGIRLISKSIDLTDAFVVALFEDKMVRTSIIWDSLNPRWMPESERAFAFRIYHPTSILRLGVFDYDVGIMNDHDPIGRLVIPTTNFNSHTNYLLHYKIRSQNEQEADRPTGRQRPKDARLTLRLRIEWDDEEEAMIRALQPPPRFVVNVDNDKSYKVLRYLTRGPVDLEQVTLASTKSYYHELQSYWYNICYVLDVLLGVLLWRGYMTVEQKGEEKKVWFPLHSLVLMTCAVAATEHPNQILAIMSFGCAWVMIASNHHLSRSPSPWKRVKNFVLERTLVSLLLSKYFKLAKLSASVRPYQGHAEQVRLEKLENLKAERMSTLIDASITFVYEVYNVYNKTNELSMQVTNDYKEWSPLEGYLSTVHTILKVLCQSIRAFRSIINWNTCLSQSITIAFVWVGSLWVFSPTRVIFHWIVRVLIWGFFGPWMKLIDARFFDPWYKSNDDILKCIDCGDDPSNVIQSLPDFESFLDSKVFLKMGQSGRVLAEKVLKLKDMRELIFGVHGEVVPAYDVSMSDPSIPLPNSYANAHEEAQISPSAQFFQVSGQLLHGDMILSQ